jgi:hypothetical protein
VIVLALAALSQAPRLRAQSGQPPQAQLLLITEVQLKPDSAPDWTELQKSEQIPAQKKGGVLWRDTWASGVAGDAYLRAIVTPIADLALFDGPSPAIKALGQEGAAALGAKTRKLIAGSRSAVIRTRPDLGFGTRPAAYKLAILTTVTVVNGRAADFEAFIKTDVAPALKKVNVSYYSVSQVVYGGNTNEFRTLIPVNDFAEIAKGHPLERALGSDGMIKLLQKSAPFISQVDRTIIRYLPDLSFQARPAS